MNIRKTENIHILLWLIKDTCWVLNIKLLGMLMIIPTVGVAVFIAYLTRNRFADFLHNLAICCWICANAVWMTGEFFYEDSMRPFALIFFVAGLLAITFYYIRKIQLVSKYRRRA